MSKSAGNFFTVKDIAEKYPLQVLRFFMLSAHYRSPLNFSDDLMEAASKSLERIRTAVFNLGHLEEASTETDKSAEDNAYLENLDELTKKYEAAMEDDFNTADAISVVFEIVKLANSELTAESNKALIVASKELIVKLCDILGVICEEQEEMLDDDIESLIAERSQAKKERNFARADEIRVELLSKGIQLEDTREGVRWKRI